MNNKMWGGRFASGPAEIMEEINASIDFDRKLAAQDIAGSEAHLAMLARQGIVAHTVSSFGLHTDYHQPSDELSTIDFPHMVKAIQSMIEPIGWLASASFRPTWNPGGKP